MSHTHSTVEAPRVPHLVSLHRMAMRQGRLICADVGRHLHFDLGRAALFDRFLIAFALVFHKVGDAGAETAIVRIICTNKKRNLRKFKLFLTKCVVTYFSIENHKRELIID